MRWLLTTCLGLLLPALLRPPLFDCLPPASQCQRIGGYIIGNCRTRCHISPFANAHWRYQSGIAADKCAVFHDGDMLVHSIVVAGNSSRAHIHACADLRITKISEMVGLGAFAQPAFFG